MLRGHLQEFFKNIWDAINNEKSRNFWATLNTNSVHGTLLWLPYTIEIHNRETLHHYFTLIHNTTEYKRNMF